MNIQRFLVPVLLPSLLIASVASTAPTHAAPASPSEPVPNLVMDDIGTSLSLVLNWVTESDQAAAELGYSVGTAGDVNGDGWDDVIVGVPKYSNGVDKEGAAFVFHGSASGLSANPDWTVGSQQTGARFGAAVGTAGDVNGDGYDDVIVGAYRYNNDQPEEGRAFVFYGSPSGLSPIPDWAFESDQKEANLGSSVGTAGDVNGDGYADVIVGARWYTNGQTSEGAAFVFHGSESGLSTTPDWSAESDQPTAVFGTSVGTAGDVNNDGYSDVIVGAPQYGNDQEDEGAVFVFYGSAAGLSTTADWTAESDQDAAEFGASVGTAGDVNKDGYDDVIVGAPQYDNDQADEGAVFVFCGSASGLSTTAAWMADSDQEGSRFGASVGTAGDVNGDGYDDVIVGAYLYQNDQSLEGVAFVFGGSAAGLSATANWRAEGDKADTGFGYAVGTAGDVNDDGYDDVIVGAPQYRHETELRGRAFVYHCLGSSTDMQFHIYLPLVVRASS